MVSATSFLPNFFTQSCLRLLHLYSRKEYVSLWIVILDPFVNLFKWIAYGCTSSVESFIYFSLTVKSALLVKLHCWFYNLLLIRSFTAGSCASILSRWSFQTQLLSGFYWMYFFVFSLTVWPLLPQFPFCPLRSFRSTLFHCRKKNCLTSLLANVFRRVSPSYNMIFSADHFTRSFKLYPRFKIPSRNVQILKGLCHGDFSVCCPTLLKYLTKNLFWL